MGQAKNKKQRECPAKGGVITPEDCGRSRNSLIACPADCIHNPFAIANYREQFGTLEEKVLGLLSRKLAPELTPSRLREVRGLIESGSEFALHAFQAWEIHGTGRLEKWMADGLHRDWKNDERVLLGCLAALRPALLELETALLPGDGGSSSEVGLLFREFADKPNSGLGGRSAREVAADPALRPKLVLQMKRLVAGVDHQRRTRGVDFDLNPLLRELGLDEIILPPPPLGFAEDEEYEEYEDDEIPLDPPPSQDSLEGEELANRLERVISYEALWNRLDIRLADILDAFNDLSDKLNPNELGALQSTVLWALGALHPDQPPGYEPSPERMLARYETWIRSGDDQESIRES